MVNTVGETRSALKVATAWGYVDAGAARDVDTQLDRILGMLWGLTRRRKAG